jgi:fructose-1,6-bisphosphatase/inositol monophosphatase family enzyme
MLTSYLLRGAYTFAICILLKLPASSSLQIGPLLSTCVDACQRGCAEIRKVQAARETNDNTLLKVELKDVQDPRSALTEADKAAQRAIVGSLRAEWGDELRIVGEENDDDEFTETLATMKFDPLDRDLFVDDMGEESADIDASKITIFVDPLDGTREFVEGRLESCQVLVGIAIDGESVAGAVGIPFLDGTMDNDSTIIYGLDGLGTGVIGATLTRGPFPLERNIDGVKYPRPHRATGDSTAEVMEACRKRAIERFGGSTVIYGGAGNKILAAALGEVTCSIQHKVGGPVSRHSIKF